MDADQRIRQPEHGPPRSYTAVAPDALVVLRKPRRLRGSTAIVRRAVPGGWEVEVRSPLGTPMHLVLPAKALLLV